jgi:hypothetical protein
MATQFADGKQSTIAHLCEVAFNRLRQNRKNAEKVLLGIALQNDFKKHLAQKFVVNVLRCLVVLTREKPLCILRKDHCVVSRQSFDENLLVNSFSLVSKFVKERKVLVSLDIYELHCPQKIGCLKVWKESHYKVVFDVSLNLVDSDEELDDFVG